MIAYVDSSVVLRVVLGQPEQLPEWGQIVTGVASRLIEVECLRSIDRLRARGFVTTEQAVVRREAVFRVLEALQLVDVSPTVLHRAGESMAAPLGPLDAIHFATALMWQEANQKPLVFATHDRELALAARGSGIRVIGVRS